MNTEDNLSFLLKIYTLVLTLAALTSAIFCQHMTLQLFYLLMAYGIDSHISTIMQCTQTPHAHYIPCS